MDGIEQLRDAIMLAVSAEYEKPLDKGGQPYFLHPLRVMMRMDTPEQMMAAVLHDVVEDTQITLEDLTARGYPPAVIDAVERLTRHDEEEDYEAYINRLAPSDLARKVKLADLEDNMDVRRLRSISEKDQRRLDKYLKTWRRLRAGSNAANR
jgi:(p)ppGpp synthase/HD superfamily hydrolase